MSPNFHWPSFSRPYSRLLGIRVDEWSKRFEERMMVATKAHEDLANIEASVGDLVPLKAKKKTMKKTWEFGHHW